MIINTPSGKTVMNLKNKILSCYTVQQDVLQTTYETFGTIQLQISNIPHQKLLELVWVKLAFWAWKERPQLLVWCQNAWYWPPLQAGDCSWRWSYSDWTRSWYQRQCSDLRDCVGKNRESRRWGSWLEGMLAAGLWDFQDCLLRTQRLCSQCQSAHSYPW